jgi:hypothetical protein
MSIWLVVWVVLMILWLIGGGWVANQGGPFNGTHFAGHTLIPWACVLILGLFVFGAFSPGPGPAPTHYR